MKKYLYHLELSVKNFDLMGNPEPDDVDSGWAHLFGSFKEAAQFVFDIVHDRSEIGYPQREITILKLTRYAEGGLDPKRKSKRTGTGFHQWHHAIKFEGITLEDINSLKINQQTHKEFIKDLASFWKEGFDGIDNRLKQHLKDIGNGKYHKE
jgi:hypothetical protein